MSTTSATATTSTTTATAAAAPASGSQRPGRRPTVGRILAWTAMILIILVTLLPFYWVLRTALSSNA